MAKVILTIKLMPDSPEADLDAIQANADKIIKEFGSEIGKVEIEPIAFGLKAIKLYLVLEEGKGSPDDLEENLRAMDHVNSAETIDVRRALG